MSLCQFCTSICSVLCIFDRSMEPMCLSSGVERRRSQHVSWLILLNVFVMSRRSSTPRVTGCMYVLGVSMNKWYWACALRTMTRQGRELQFPISFQLTL